MSSEESQGLFIHDTTMDCTDASPPPNKREADEEDFPPRKRRAPPSKKKLLCFMDGCDYETYTRDLMEDHMQFTHECICLDLGIHKCESAVQVGQGREDEVALDLKNSSFKLSKKALKGVLFLFEREIKEDLCYVVDVFNLLKPDLVSLLETLVRKLHGITITFKMYCDMSEVTFDVNHKNAVIGSGSWIRITNETHIESSLLRAAHYMILILNFYNEGGSDWIVSKITKMTLLVGELNPMPRGRGFLEIPIELKFRKGLVNLNERDGFCFHLCIMAFLHSDEIWDDYVKVQEEAGRDMSKPSVRFEKYRILRNIDKLRMYLETTNVNFACLDTSPEKGVPIDGFLENWEEINNISITVYHHIGAGAIRPLRFPLYEREKHVDLLFLTKGSVGHYVLIKDKGLFFGRSGEKRHISCAQCEKRFIKKSAKDNHLITCQMGANATQILKPPQKSGKSFENYAMTLEQPNVIFLELHHQEIKVENKILYVPLSYAFSVFEYGKQQGISYYDGEDIFMHLLENLLQTANFLLLKQKRNIPYCLSQDEQKRHDSETHCFACGGEFTPSQPSCVNHCHYRGVYLNAMHINPCNPIVTLPKCITVISFQGTNFIHRLLEKGFSKKIVTSIKPITSPIKGIIGVRLNSILRIVDAKNFTTDVSFNEFIGSTAEEDALFSNTKGFFTSIMKENCSQTSLNNMLKHPPLYPKSHSLSSFLVHNEVNAKDFEDFDKKSDDANLDFTSFQLLLENVQIGTAGRYLEIVSKLRLLMLGDAFSFLRNIFFEISQLDFLYSWTIHSFSFEDMLFCMKGKQIEYIMDAGMRQMASELVRGPISHITKRLASSNSKTYGSFDPRLPEAQLVAMDIRSSYLWTMLQDLPISDYEWLSEEELGNFNFTSSPETEFGYVFEATLVLPNELHDDMDELPLFNEKFVFSMQPVDTSQPSLSVPIQAARSLLHLGPKIKKCYYHKSIHLMLQQGYKLVSVSRGFRFRQEPFMKDFAQKYMRQRFNFKSKLYQGLMKLMVNTISGKCIADKLSYGKTEFCFTPGKAKRLLARDNLKEVVILSEGCVMFTMGKRSGPEENLKLQGAVIYELSKIRLYSIFYDFLRPQFQKSMELLLSNTDSYILLLKLKEEEYIKKLKGLASIMDFSSLEKNSKLGKALYSEENKNKPGMLRFTHTEIMEYAALRPNCYSLQINKGEKNTEEFKISGTSKSARGTIRHVNFKNAILKSEETKIKLVSSKVVGHETIVTISDRLVLSGLDLSRHWIDNWNSRSFGHYKLSESHPPVALRQVTGREGKFVVKC